jgi:cytochrome c oxidase subunit II
MPDINFYLQPLASAEGAALDHTLNLVHWLMLVLFVGWGSFFAYVLFRFRAGRHPKADPVGVRSHASTWLEGGVFLAEVILLVGFSIPLWAKRVDQVPDEASSTVVRVVGEQFAWNIHYPGADGVFGKTDPKRVDPQSNPLGLDPDDPAGKDDITTLNQLHVPVGKPVVVRLSSKDVIHSFGVPHMRAKQDAIPGLSIPVWFTPTVTTAEMRQRTGNAEFQYEIACAQLCGLGHSTMRGFLTVETPEEYQAWLAAQAPAQGGDAFWQ